MRNHYHRYRQNLAHCMQFLVSSSLKCIPLERIHRFAKTKDNRFSTTRNN